MKIKAKEIKVGDVMSLTYYVKVSRAISESEIYVKDIFNGQEIQVRGKELIENCSSADQFDEEKKVTKTEAAELIIGSAGKPMTVSFVKQDGKERTIRCRLLSHETLLGRSMVEDLDTDAKNRVRQVDHRTINYVIVDGVKHIVK